MLSLERLLASTKRPHQLTKEVLVEAIDIARWNTPEVVGCDRRRMQYVDDLWTMCTSHAERFDCTTRQWINLTQPADPLPSRLAWFAYTLGADPQESPTAPGPVDPQQPAH